MAHIVLLTSDIENALIGTDCADILYAIAFFIAFIAGIFLAYILWERWY